MNKFPWGGLIIALGFIWVFLVGFFLAKLLSNDSQTEITSTNVTSTIPLQTEYHLVAITNSAPKYILTIDYVDRANEKNTVLKGVAHFLEYKDDSAETNDWQVSKVFYGSFFVDEVTGEDNLKNNVTGELVFEGFDIAFNVAELRTVLPVRSEKEFTKFVGVSEGILTINDVPYPAKFTLTKGFNDLYSAVNVEELGASTDWFVLWDQAGNFYFLDQTTVQNPSQVYESHKFFGVINTSLGLTQILEDYEVIENSNQQLEVFFYDYTGAKNYTLDLGPYYNSDAKMLYKTNFVSSNQGVEGVYLQVNKPIQ